MGKVVRMVDRWVYAAVVAVFEPGDHLRDPEQGLQSVYVHRFCEFRVVGDY